MEDIRTLKANQLDALREVANIGAGHAATALSQMIGSTIMITVPRINVAQMENLPPLVTADNEPVAAVVLNMLGDLNGRALLVFPRVVAMRIAEMMLRRAPHSLVAMGEMEQSAIKEAGNILSSAYMNALADFMGMVLLPSPPSLTIDMSAAVLSTGYLKFGSETDYVFCVESEFYLKGVDEKLRGYFLMIPDTASLNAILRAIRLA